MQFTAISALVLVVGFLNRVYLGDAIVPFGVLAIGYICVLLNFH